MNATNAPLSTPTGSLRAVARLTVVELRRIMHRRITRATALVLIAVLTLIGVRTFTVSSSAPPDMVAAERQAEMHEAECRDAVTADGSSWSDAELTEMCFVDPNWLVRDEAFHLRSLLANGGDASWAEIRTVHLEGYEYQTTEAGAVRRTPAPGFDGELATGGALMALLAAGLAATFVGADWRSGLIESQLVWVPNRRRLYAAKLAASAVTGAAMSVAFSILLIVAVVPSVIWRGDAAGTGRMFWLDATAVIGLAALAAALFAMLAAGIAMVARNTAAGVVGLVAWSIVTGILNNTWGASMSFVSPVANVEAFISRGDVSYLETVMLPSGGSEFIEVVSHGWLGAGLVILAMAVVSGTASTSAFVRRDLS